MTTPATGLPAGWTWYPGLRQAQASIAGYDPAITVGVAKWGVDLEVDTAALSDAAIRAEIRRLEREAAEEVIPWIERWISGPGGG